MKIGCASCVLGENVLQIASESSELDRHNLQKGFVFTTTLVLAYPKRSTQYNSLIDTLFGRKLPEKANWGKY
jgi:hypothetical protein